MHTSLASHGGDSLLSRIFRQYEWVAVLLVLLFSLLFTTYELTTYPEFWFDEALNLGQARNLAEQGYINLQTAPGAPYAKPYHLTTGYPVIAPLALLFSVFGFDFGLARLYMILWLLLFLLSAYLLARSFFGSEKAFFSLLLLASFAPVYGNGETVIAEVPALALLFLATLCLRHARRSGGFFCAGLLFGLCASVKPLYIILAPALALSACVSRRTFSWRREALLWLGFVLPVMLYISTLLPPLAVESGNGSLISFWQSRVTRGDFSEHVRTNIIRMMTESSLLYTLLLSLLVAAMVPWRRLREGAVERAPLVLGFYALLTFAYFIQNIGWNRYLLAYQAILFLFLPAALERTLSVLRKMSPLARFLPAGVSVERSALLAAAAGLILMQSTHLFCCATIFRSTTADEFETFFRKNTPKGDVYVVNSAEAAAFVPSSRLYQYFDFFEETPPPMQNRLANLDAERFDHLVVSTEDRAVMPYLSEIEKRYRAVGEVQGLTLYARR
ncbi:MAG TPA: glycosyltransferase family 39 protein [Candidatus Paceibacterota bacterium]